MSPERCFRADDRIAMIGDSITADGRWWALAMAHHLARLPGRSPTWFNCGIAGDAAARTLDRFDDDIAPHAPTVAVVMLGMNDVDRELYGLDRHGEAWHRRRLAALAGHRASLARLVVRLRGIGVRRLILCTPTPYDDGMAAVCPNLRGVGDALTACGAGVRELASRHGAEVVDFNTPMRALNLRLQAADPAATLIGPDRVHPGWPGHAVMAGILLDHLGLPPAWLDVVIDTASPDADGWRVESLVRSPAEVAFTLSGGGAIPPLNALGLTGTPWPSLAGTARLAVGGLQPGRWTLLVGGSAVGTWDAAAWAAGIDPTGGPGPWHAHGAGILAACLAWIDSEHPARRQRMLCGWAGCPPDDHAGLRRIIARWRAGDPSTPAWIRPMLAADWLPGVLRLVDAAAAQPERGRADRLAARQRIAKAARPCRLDCRLVQAG
jgi:lysophospholipase L1-like esterase